MRGMSLMKRCCRDLSSCTVCLCLVRTYSNQNSLRIQWFKNGRKLASRRRRTSEKVGEQLEALVRAEVMPRGSYAVEYERRGDRRRQRPDFADSLGEQAKLSFEEPMPEFRAFVPTPQSPPPRWRRSGELVSKVKRAACQLPNRPPHHPFLAFRRAWT